LRNSTRVFEFCSGLVDLVLCVGGHGGGGHRLTLAGERFIGLVAEDITPGGRSRRESKGSPARGRIAQTHDPTAHAEGGSHPCRPIPAPTVTSAGNKFFIICVYMQTNSFSVRVLGLFQEESACPL